MFRGGRLGLSIYRMMKIYSKLGSDVNFEFRPVTNEDIAKCIKKLDSKNLQG